ncbi:RTA1-domain-containing protein [Auricularia subglabra TFB-10046 SS5]|nr:RTA1-domain-containing protein [Auricularia subglabra TFB-10046 SS5]
MAPLPQQDSPYHYTPTEYVCGIFVALFALSTFIHLGQAIRYKLWWLLATAVLCGVGETIGWSARLWSSLDIAARDPFLIHIAPTFLVASNFIILGRVIRLVGPQFSRLSPSMYSIVFLTADTAALIVQAVGGAQASAADTREGADKGAKIMLGGIIVQFVAIIVYVSLAAEFIIRYKLNKPLRGSEHARPERLDSKLRLMVLGLGISTIFIVIRTVYRTIELQNGWNGKIISNEVLFNVLDGMPITVAMYTLIIFHPGRLVYNADRKEPGQDSPVVSSPTPTIVERPQAWSPFKNSAVSLASQRA